MEHQPVLLQEVITVLSPQEGEIFADLTAGYGGHAIALLDNVGKSGHGYLFDQDNTALAALSKRFGDTPNITITKSNFDALEWESLPAPDMILLDIGVSSPQLDTPERGFSFRTDGPLDMRMNQDSPYSAYELVNRASERELADIIYQYGEERASRKIARAIVTARKQQPIATTAQLASIIAEVSPKHSKIDPATKTFQALRIAVNNELAALEQVLPLAAKHLRPGGRLAVISFHSLEDRIVKRFFRSLTTDTLNDFGQVAVPAPFQNVTKKAITGKEFDTNPRARSAKLRAVVKK